MSSVFNHHAHNPLHQSQQSITNIPLSPASVTSQGTGYPACVTYDTNTIVGGEGFTGDGSGGYTAYFNIAQPGQGCATIIKSPANTDLPGCGVTVGGFKNAICAAIDLKETFMVQFCCGSGDCTAAGVGARSIRGIDYRSLNIGRGATLQFANGTEIEPLQIGFPPEVEEPAKAIKKRASCSSYSANGDIYTIPAPNTQIVGENLNGGTGGATFAVTATREQSSSTTIETGANVLDIISASLSVTFEQSISDSKAYTFNIPAGQSGQLGFTSTLQCTDGMLHPYLEKSFWGE